MEVHRQQAITSHPRVPTLTSRRISQTRWLHHLKVTVLILSSSLPIHLNRCHRRVTAPTHHSRPVIHLLLASMVSAGSYRVPTASPSEVLANTWTVGGYPPHNSTPQADADLLRKAMKGFGTNEDQVSAVYTLRSEVHDPFCHDLRAR